MYPQIAYISMLTSTKVLLPSCFGSRIVEDELKQMQTVISHVRFTTFESGFKRLMVTLQILKMVVTEEQFTLYTRANPDTLESSSDHPEGMIAEFLQEKHPNDPNLHRYERKVSD